MGLPNIIKLILSSITEVTTGSASLSQGGNLPLMASVISFAGFSVHCQVLSSAAVVAPKISTFMAARLTHAAISACITYILIRIFPMTVAVISTLDTTPSAAIFSFPAAAALVLMAVSFLFFAGTNNSKERKSS
jgi:hypothetical protein